MPYEVLEKKLQAVPEKYFSQVSSFLDIILSLANNNSTSSSKQQGHPILGLGKGLFTVPDDIHFADDEIQDMFEEYV